MKYYVPIINSTKFTVAIDVCKTQVDASNKITDYMEEVKKTIYKSTLEEHEVDYDIHEIQDIQDIPIMINAYNNWILCTERHAQIDNYNIPVNFYMHECKFKNHIEVLIDYIINHDAEKYDEYNPLEFYPWDFKAVLMNQQ